MALKGTKQPFDIAKGNFGKAEEHIKHGLDQRGDMNGDAWSEDFPDYKTEVREYGMAFDQILRILAFALRLIKELQDMPPGEYSFDQWATDIVDKNPDARDYKEAISNAILDDINRGRKE